MTVVKRSRNGNYDLVKNNLNIIQDNMRSAIGSIRCTIPRGFTYYNYLTSLDNKLATYNELFEDIERVLLKSEQNLEQLFSDSKRELDSLHIQKSKDRNLMI